METGKALVVLQRAVEDRYQGVSMVLERFKKLEFEALRMIRDQRVLIKPNCVSSTRQLAATHVDALRAVLNMVIELDPKKVILGEGSAMDTFEAFRKFSYMSLAKEYDLELLDLNKDEYEELPIYDGYRRKLSVRVSKTALESFRISLAIPKTHDTVIITASFKNMVVGSVLQPDKVKIHQGYPAINLNIALLGRFLRPHIGVIDGFEGMEGDGPVGGTKVEHRIALASTDPIALDAMTAYLMGFSPNEVGYLVHANRLGLGEIDLSRIELEGGTIADTRRHYKPHSTYSEQRGWDIEGTGLEKVLK